MKEMSDKDVPNARFSCPVIFKAKALDEGIFDNAASGNFQGQLAKASDEGIFDNAVSGILLPPLEFRILTN